MKGFEVVLDLVKYLEGLEINEVVLDLVKVWRSLDKQISANCSGTGMHLG